MNDLAVVHEKVDGGTVILDIPTKDCRIGSLKHQVFQADGGHEFGGDVTAPALDAFCDALGFDP